MRNEKTDLVITFYESYNMTDKKGKTESGRSKIAEFKYYAGVYGSDFAKTMADSLYEKIMEHWMGSYEIDYKVEYIVNNSCYSWPNDSEEK